MAVETRAQNPGFPEQSRPPIPQKDFEPTQAELGKIVDDFIPKILDTVDPYISNWAGPDWKDKGLPTNGLLASKPSNIPDISWFGTKPQGGPSQVLRLRMEDGRGALFQKANPEARSIAGKKNNFIYWDSEGKARQGREDAEVFLKELQIYLDELNNGSLRKKALATVAS